MILHKTNYLNSTIFTLFDSQERVVINATRYIQYLQRSRRSVISKQQIASVVKLHCDWLETTTYFASLTIDEILAVVNGDDIADWINYQRSSGLSENTIHNREVLIRKMYEYFTTEEASVRKNIPWNNKHFTKSQHRKLPRFLTAEQIVKLLLGFHHESQRVAVHFAFDTGVRVSELIRLTVNQLPKPVDYPNWFNYYPLTVQGSKAFDGNEFKVRDTIISRPLLARVLRYHATPEYRLARGWKMDDPQKPVFLNLHGEKLSKSSFYGGIKSAWKRQGGDPREVSPHRLRHGTGYSVLNSEFGDDLQDRLLILKGIYGHNDIKTTEIYCSMPLVVLESLNKHQENKPRYQEADEIYQSTYLPGYKNTSKRGLRRR